MSGLPVLLEGEAIEALVIGGGRVGLRKALALLESGATVRVVEPSPSADLRAAAAQSARLQLIERVYDRGDIGNAQLVVAATNDRVVNSAISRHAHEEHRLVNVADAPDEGNFVTTATHRAGAIVIAVSAGGVPSVARALRNVIGERFGDEYAAAVEAMKSVRHQLLAEGRSKEWQAIDAQLAADDFCALVDSGELADRLKSWR